jgi:predicted dehydrogenase
MHSSMAVEALEAGKHVCMTKPMDIETSICDKAIEIAENKGLTLGVDFGSRYSAINHQIRSAVQSGAIGKIVLADLRMKWYRAQTYYDSGMPEGWRSRMETERGSLANQAVHYLDLMQWWLGPVEKVVGKRGTFAHDIETEDASAAVIQFASGALGSVATTTASFPNLGTAMELTGSSGTLSWQDQGITRFVAAKGINADAHKKASYDAAFAVEAEPEELDPVDFEVPEDLPENIFADMVGAIRDGKPLQCDGREGRKSVALFEAIYRSSDQESWVRL